MHKQKSRQLNRYRRHRPVDTEEYLQGVNTAAMCVRNGVSAECPYHFDSGRALRWTLGYQDELLYIASKLHDRRKSLCYCVTRDSSTPTNLLSMSRDRP